METNTANLPAQRTELTTNQLVLLAREIAIDIRNLNDILNDFHITEEEYQKISALPFFKNALEAATIEWNSALSTHQRIKVRSAAALEDALPTLAARMTDENETLPAAVETGKLFAKLAEIGERSTGTPGEKFSITINLGDDKKLTFTKDITPAPPLIEPNEDKNEPS